MLNAEKYKDEILEILEHARLAFDENTDSLCSCDECDCNDCKFNNHQTNCGLECFKWLMEEYKEPILTDEECEYLKAVCKPFEVEYIAKYSNKNKVEWLCINIKTNLAIGDVTFALPFFETDTMYKGMEVDKKYTLSELGISYD